MKKLLLLLLLGLVPNLVMAQTAKAIWCAGNSTLYFTYDNTTYSAGGTYDGQTITAVYEVSSSGYSYYTNRPWNNISSSVTNVVISSNFNLFRPTSLAYWFYGFSNLTIITGCNYLNTSNVTTLEETFYGCSSLISLDVSSWNTSNVISMRYTFCGCNNLTSLDVSNWNTGNVTEMSSTFSHCRSLTSLDISKWDTSNVTGMASTFSDCPSLTSLDVSDWDTSNVKYMSGLFSGCSSLFLLDVSSWSTSNVTNLSNTFSGCYNLSSLDVSNWDTSKVTILRSTFYGCSSLTSLNLSNWDTRNVTTLEDTFSGCSSLTSLDVSSWNTSNVTTLYRTFYGCSSLTSLDLRNWDTSNVTNMGSTFFGCSSLTLLDVSNWDTSNVTTLENTFYNCSSLTSLDVSDWDTSNVTNMGSTFFGCSSLTSLDVSDWDTSNVTNMGSTFFGCSSLTSLDVSKWNTGNVTSLTETFDNCSSLTSLNLSNWDTSNVTFLSFTFSNCSSLTSLDVSNWDTRNVTDMGYAFNRCSSLTSLTFGKDFSTTQVTNSNNLREMFYGCSNLRYIDFYDSDDTDAITSVDKSTYNTMFNGVPSTTVIYLPHGSQTVTNGQNVVYSYNGDETDLRCPNYYSDDKVDIELPRAFKTNRARYFRMMSSTYGSVVLPYDFTSNSNIQAYTLDEEHVGSMTFKNAATVPAHTPFAFQKLASSTTARFVMEDATGNFGITVQAAHDTKDNPYTATTNLTGWTTKGYYAAQTVDDYSDAFYISGDKIYKADGPLTLYPHRVTFHGTWTQGTPGTGAKNLEIADMATCISSIDNSELIIDNYYDLSGRRVQSNKVTGLQSNMLPKGIYIVNGKKMVVK